MRQSRGSAGQRHDGDHIIHHPSCGLQTHVDPHRSIFCPAVSHTIISSKLEHRHEVLIGDRRRLTHCLYHEDLKGHKGLAQDETRVVTRFQFHSNP